MLLFISLTQFTGLVTILLVKIAFKTYLSSWSLILTWPIRSKLFTCALAVTVALNPDTTNQPTTSLGLRSVLLNDTPKKVQEDSMRLEPRSSRLCVKRFTTEPCSSLVNGEREKWILSQWLSHIYTSSKRILDRTSNILFSSPVLYQLSNGQGSVVTHDQFGSDMFYVSKR